MYLFSIFYNGEWLKDMFLSQYSDHDMADSIQLEA